jgi:hypothetical protein
MMSSLSETTPKHKEKPSEPMLKLSLTTRNISTKNMVMLSNTKLKTLTSLKIQRPVIGVFKLKTRRPLSITGLLLKLTMS